MWIVHYRNLIDADGKEDVKAGDVYRSFCDKEDAVNHVHNTINKLTIGFMMRNGLGGHYPNALKKAFANGIGYYDFDNYANDIWIQITQELDYSVY